MNFVWKKRIGIALTVFAVIFTGFFASTHYSKAEDTVDIPKIQRMLQTVPRSGESKTTSELAQLKASLNTVELEFLTQELTKRALLGQLSPTSSLLTSSETDEAEARAAWENFLGITLPEKTNVSGAKFKAISDAAASGIAPTGLITNADEQTLFNQLSSAKKTQRANIQGQSSGGDLTCSGVSSFLSSSTIGNCIKLGIVSLLNIVIFLFGLLLRIATYAFDTIYTISVTNFATFVSDKNGIGKAIVQIWQIGRDLSNMFFIFILVASGVGTMVGYGKLDIRKNLASVIFIAFLINFSMPIARVIIDANNILAEEFFVKIHPANNCTIGAFVTSKLTPNISGQIPSFLNFSNLCDPDLGKVPQSSAPAIGELDSLSIIATMFGAWFIITTAAFTFFMGAFFLLYRMVALVFVLALGPLAFLSSLIPRTERYYNQWWDELINESLFAPVYLFLLYFVLRVIETVGDPLAFVKGITAPANSTGAIANFATSASYEPLQLGIYYLIVFTLLNGASVIANDLSKGGSKFAEGWANWTMGYLKKPYQGAGNLFRQGAIGAGNRVGRALPAEAARRLADSEVLKNFASGAQGTRAGTAGRVINTVFGTGATTAVRGALQNIGSQSFGQTQVEKEAKASLDQFKGDIRRQAALLAEMEPEVAQKSYEGLSDEDKIRVERALTAGSPERTRIEALRTEYVRNKTTNPATGAPSTPTSGKKVGELGKAEGTIDKEDLIGSLGSSATGTYTPPTPVVRGTPRVRVAPRGTHQASLHRMNNEEIGKVLNGLVGRTPPQPLGPVINDMKLAQFKSFVMNIENLSALDQRVLDGIRDLYISGGMHEELGHPFLDMPAAGMTNQARANLGIDQTEPNH